MRLYEDPKDCNHRFRAFLKNHRAAPKIVSVLEQLVRPVPNHWNTRMAEHGNRTLSRCRDGLCKRIAVRRD